MGLEAHAFGTTLFFIPRRLFVLGFSAVMSVLCFVQIFMWIFEAHFWNQIAGTSWPWAHQKGCTGTDCFEVFSCFGMKDAAWHLRQPFVTLVGAVLFPVGAVGAYTSARTKVQALSVFVTVDALLHLGLLAWDGVYYGTCNAFSANMVHQTLLQWPPISPLTPASRSALEGMTYYPIDRVHEVVQNVSAEGWYFGMAALWAAFLLYAAWECSALGLLLERGPLGLGVNYGISWDEAVNHDAIRRHKERQKFSAFVDDCKIPLNPVDVEERGGFEWAGPGSGYGAVAADKAGFAAPPAAMAPEAPFAAGAAPAAEPGFRSPQVSYFEEDADAAPLSAEAAAEAEAEAVRQWIEEAEGQEPRGRMPLPASFFEEDMPTQFAPTKSTPAFAAAPLTPQQPWRDTV